MQNPNVHPWSWGHGPPAPAFSGVRPVMSASYPPTGNEQTQMLPPGYHQIYGNLPVQPDYAQWTSAQAQQWQQWQQWQEKYRQWQVQYGKKFEESLAALGQNSQVSFAGIPPVLNAQKHLKSPSVLIPPLPANSHQPVPPPPPDEDKPPPPGISEKETERACKNKCREAKDKSEDLSEAEKTFDIQFKQWEGQFNAWKKENQDHPDKAQYKEYEKKWETWREQLLQRREQMRKKRLGHVSAEGGSCSFISGVDEEINKKEFSEVDHGDGNGSANAASYDGEANHELRQFSDGQPSNYSIVVPSSNFTQRNLADVGNRVLKPNRNIYSSEFSIGRASGPEEKAEHDKPPSNAIGSADCHQGDFVNQGGSFFGNNSKDYGKKPNMRTGNCEEWVKEENLNTRPRNVSFNEISGQKIRNFDSLFARPRVGNGSEKKAVAFVPPPKSLLENFEKFRNEKNSDSQQNFDFLKNKEAGPCGLRKGGFDGLEDFRQVLGSASSAAKPKVPSLFDITVEKPPCLMNLNSEKNQKIWEKCGDSADSRSKEENRDSMRFRGSGRPLKGNSPWLQPWEYEKMKSEKIQESRWQESGIPDSFCRNSLLKKEEIDKVELSGYVGNILAKLGHFNAPPPNIGNAFGDGIFSVDTKSIKEASERFVGKPLGSYEDTEYGGRFRNQNSNVQSKVSVRDFRSSAAKADEFPEETVPKAPSRGYLSKTPSLDNLEESAQFPYSKSRFKSPDRNSNGSRNFEEGDSTFREEEERGAFSRDNSRNVVRTFPEDDRRSCGNEPKVFGRDDARCFIKMPREEKGFASDRFDVHRGSRRHFERFDRDEREPRGGFERSGRRIDRLPNEPLWDPQIFDHSRGRFSRLFEFEKGFKISTVVDYSHGERKQTFDYGHGSGSRDALEMKSFDYGHGGDFPTVIDYGHGVKSESEPNKNQTREDQSGRSGSVKNRLRSPSRSPNTRRKGNSTSPPFKDKKPKNREGSAKHPAKRSRRNSEEKSSSGDNEVSKHSCDVTTVLVEDLICLPGRETRPVKLVFIMRGLPGSGKTYVTKLIKDKEIESGGDPPRILSLDDYFMTEVEKETIDEDTGRKVKNKLLEYEYEAAMESHYRGSLVKAFKKTISDGFFSFIIVDSVNEKTQDYEEMWSFAKQKGFQVYIAELDNDVTVCTGRNIHKRTEKEIADLAKVWEDTPPHYLHLDVRSLLQSDAITEVEMEVVSDAEAERSSGKEKIKEETEAEVEVGADKESERSLEAPKDQAVDEEEDEPGSLTFVQSRWDQFEHSEQNLDRLDGLKRRREGFHTTMEDYLQLADDLDSDSIVRDSVPGKKKVRWADLEERRQQEKMRAIGFVVGQTDWSRMTDPTFGESALTKTKYI